MRRQLVKYPDPVLHKVARPIKIIDDKIRELLSDMVETMYAEDGVGIAAPQVGESVRAVAIDISVAVKDSPGLLKMINPEIVSREGEMEWEEGCLSVPGFTQKMKRSARLHVRYKDENGTDRELDAEGLLAVAVQQEIDHLDGKLILHSASSLKRDMYDKKVKKRAK